MRKRSTYEMEKRILYKVAEGKAKYTDIQLSTNTNYDTVKAHVTKFAAMGIVAVQKIAEDRANGRPSYEISLTPLGKEVVKNLKSR